MWQKIKCDIKLIMSKQISDKTRKICSLYNCLTSITKKINILTYLNIYVWSLFWKCSDKYAIRGLDQGAWYHIIFHYYSTRVITSLDWDDDSGVGCDDKIPGGWLVGWGFIQCPDHGGHCTIVKFGTRTLIFSVLLFMSGVGCAFIFGK